MVEPQSMTMQAKADELVEQFSWLDSLEEQYQYLIDLGRALPPMSAEEKSEANRVHGCQSQVWIATRTRPGTADVVEFEADSDAHIVRGLVAILREIYWGQPAAQILAFDIEGLLRQLGLDQHLSLGRRNGLNEMVRRIKIYATTLEPQAGFII